MLVDDQSRDDTAAVARATAKALGCEHKLSIVSGSPLLSGWTGKVWAQHQGITQANEFDSALTTAAQFQTQGAKLFREVMNRDGWSAQDSADMRQVEVRQGDATSLPIADGSIDVVSSNGVLNLVPEKERGFGEIVRALKPGGRLHLADIALDVELPEDARRNIDLWTG